MIMVMRIICPHILAFFFFNDTATTEIYTLSLHDALPIFQSGSPADDRSPFARAGEPERRRARPPDRTAHSRSEEHTSELQSRLHLVCRLLLEKKKTLAASRLFNSVTHE